MKTHICVTVFADNGDGKPISTACYHPEEEENFTLAPLAISYVYKIWSEECNCNI